MQDLHPSFQQHRMIAQINIANDPHLIIFNGRGMFTSSGSTNGTRVSSQVFLAGTIGVSIDAVGVALPRIKVV
jgi:uncharacterized protein (DUF362 family)